MKSNRINMKKITLLIITAFLLLTVVPTPLKAGTNLHETSTTSAKAAESVEAKTLLSRLEVIHSMNKSSLNSSDKKQLRKEVRSIKSHLKELQGGVYLSVGAVIIIILLLIILL